ncbi:MAG: hypothetical protein ACRDKZ_03005 [Actinomycetota bacterium]
MADDHSAITRQAVQELIASENMPALSIYFPTRRGVAEPEENSLKLKDALKDARRELGQSMRTPDVDEFLEPLTSLLDDVRFWRGQAEGLALFRSKDFFRTFRLPFPVDAEIAAAEHFHLKPLLPALSTQGYFFILALSQNAVRLMRASRYGISEVDLDGVEMPKSLAEALQYDVLERGGLQTHSGGRMGGQNRRQGGQAVFHGREGSEEHKEQILRFFQGVDHGLHEVLRTSHEPLIVAAVEYLRPLYRQASHYRYILPKGVDGNPDGLRPDELLKRAVPLIEDHYGAALEEARNRYGDAQGTGLASDDPEQVVLAAADGRIDSLFTGRQDTVWGRVDQQERKVTLDGGPGPRRVDLTDLAARETLLNGGHVYVVEREHVPTRSAMAAVFRY